MIERSKFVLKMVVRVKRDIPLRSVLVKFGVALAISLGGIVYTFFRTKRMNKPSKSKPSQPSPDCCTLSDSRGKSGGLGDDDRDHALEKESSLPKIICQNSTSDLSSSGSYSRDRECDLVPEVNALVKECNLDVTTDSMTREKVLETQVLDVESPKEYKCAEHDVHNKEIKSLQNQVKILEERERCLEIQLLEYYGLKEQETAVMELQNRLRLNTMEVKFYNLKIESLQADNSRLAAQVADYFKVVTELEAAKDKIKLLRKKLRFEAEQNREQLLSLQERVMKLQDHEKKGVESDQAPEIKRQEKNELEEELEKMKSSNHDLKLANSELAQKLEYLQMLATSALDNEEAQEIKEENQLLRQQNADLTREMEQLQADRCTDIEELVYLRWINACLRYELRNYQPGPGKTVARDLSKTLSPKSEEKAKQLILEYANKEGSAVIDFDSDQGSLCHASYLTDSGEVDDPTHSSKTKVFAKLVRLLRGKDSHHQAQASPSPLEETVSVDDVLDRYSSDPQSVISDGPIKTIRTSSGGSSRHSFDLHRSDSRGQKSTITGESCNSSRRTSEDGSLNIFRRIDSITEDVSDLSPEIQPHQDAQNAAKTELLKYAEALKNSTMKPSFRRRWRSASFSSF